MGHGAKTPPRNEAHQGGKKKTDVPTYLTTYLPFLSSFKIFGSGFGKHFCGVFELVMQRNGQKRD
jgi:hypothetical protein